VLATFTTNIKIKDPQGSGNAGGKDGLMEKLIRLMIILLFSTACDTENKFRSLSGKNAGYGEGGSFTSVASQPSAGPSWVVEPNQYGRLDVRVIDQAALDALLQSKWAAMKSALRAGDTAKAASYFTKEKVAIYKNIFDNLTIPYSQIDSYIGNIVWLQQFGVYVNYTLQANSLGLGGTVIFQLEQDNEWRIRFF
jgi:hypothetical protein